MACAGSRGAQRGVARSWSTSSIEATCRCQMSVVFSSHPQSLETDISTSITYP
jgi:hypothetical protein